MSLSPLLERVLSQSIFISYLQKNLSERLDLVLKVRETVGFFGFRFRFYPTGSDSGVLAFFSDDGRPALFPGGDGSFKHRYRRLKSGFFPGSVRSTTMFFSVSLPLLLKLRWVSVMHDTRSCRIDCRWLMLFVDS